MPEDRSGWLVSLDLTLRWLAISLFLSALIIFTSCVVSGILAGIPSDLQYERLDSEQDPASPFVYFYE